MKYNILTYISAVALLFTASTYRCAAQSRELFDTEHAKKTLTIGVRASLTSSNVSPNYNEIFSDVWSTAGDWGYGFNAGVVANLNIRNYFAIQPGIFFSNKCYDTKISTVSLVTDYASNVERHSRFYYLQIPIMASFKMNLIKNVELLMEAGPYLGIGLGGNIKVSQISYSTVIMGNNINIDQYKLPYFGKGTMKNIQMKKGDWGVKMGVGFRFAHRYSIAAYYLAGCENIAHNNRGYESYAKARNKEWNVSLGFDF
ncbi:MAG: PorT family protein [Muribaculaceae bacterium]|nr:PorT family protein [Muribaculaceae bacterium]